MSALPLLSVKDLRKTFALRTGLLGRSVDVAAVAGVSFDLGAGQTLALVGESGSGKSTTARLVLRLLTPDSGSILFDGGDWLSLSGRELNRLRRHVGVVFQDPATSLNPRMTVEEIVSEPLNIHRIGNREARRERVQSLLKAVGLPASAASRRPREFSGGQRQRIGIARALATDPKLIVLDEPVSALDVSVRAQVLNLLLDLQVSSASQPATLFIGHDLAVVRHIAHRTAVMYLGRIVEEGPTDELFAAPRHPYTSLLLASEPGLGKASNHRAAGEPPSPVSPPPGCPFWPRCPSARARCREQIPPQTVFSEVSGHQAACFYPNSLPSGT